MALRRTVLLTSGTAIVAAIAGCVSDDDAADDGENGGTGAPDETDDDASGDGETDDRTNDGTSDETDAGQPGEVQLASPEDAVETFYERMNGVENVEEYLAVVESFFHSDSALREDWEKAVEEDEDYREELEEEIEADLVFERVETAVVEEDVTAEELVDGNWFRDGEEAQPFAGENALVETEVELSEAGERRDGWVETWLVAPEDDTWQLVFVQFEARVTPATAIEWSYDEEAKELEIRHVGGDTVLAGNLEIRGENAYGHAGNTWDEYDSDVGPESDVRAGDRIVLAEGNAGGDAVESDFDVELVWDDGVDVAVIAHESGPDA